MPRPTAADENAAGDIVARYMTADVLCVREDAAVPDAVRALVERGVDGAPVVDTNERLVGMLSASDVMVQDAQVHLPTVITLFGMSAELPGQAARYNRDIQRALASTVSELMARDPLTIAPEATMSDAATRMHDADVSRLPVVDSTNRVVGIVARGDVLRYLIGAGATGPESRASTPMADLIDDAPIAVSPNEVTYNRDAWIVVDLAAIAHNARRLVRWASPARLCVVVKADGYGHGAGPVAMAALGAGADMLAVALVDEGITLRDASIAAPILVLSEPPLNALDDVVAHRLTPTLYRHEAIEAADAAARRAGVVLDVHVKIDTGMHRVGAAPDAAVELVRHVVDRPGLRMAGLFTHFAVADEPDNDFTALQDACFSGVVDAVRDAGLPTGLVHAANSAAALRNVGCRDLVRCGIALYGIVPAPAVDDAVGLRPALSLRARVSYVKRVAAGEGLSYGLRYRPRRDTQIATVPLGYADGVRRLLGERGGQVLIGGRRRPIAGTITMDQLLVDCGPDADVAVGDEVVLLGTQGAEEIPVGEWADRLDTITYEVVCGFSPRLPRFHTSRDLGAPQLPAHAAKE